MSRLQARRQLHRHAETGNWRFKGLLLGALPGTDVSPSDVARAWPDPGNASDYRFLSARGDVDPEREANRKWTAEPDEPMHRMLTDYAAGVDATDAPKHLSDDPTETLDDSRGTVGARVDEAVPRMLFAADTWEEVDTLFRDFLRETVIEGARENQVARDAAEITNVDAPRGDLPVAQDDQKARPTASGAEIREDGEQYDTVPYGTTKFGVGSRVTEELIDTASIDKIEREIQHVGRSVENAINAVWLRELVDNAGESVTTEEGLRGYAGLNDAWTEVDVNDFEPDTYASHPRFRGTLFGDPQLSYAQRSGSDDVVRERTFDPLLDLDTHAAASGSTYPTADDDGWDGHLGEETWDYQDNGEIGAVVYDSSMVEIVMYSPHGEDIEIKDYEDPIRDLQGVNARTHVDVVWGQERAGCRVEYGT